MKEPYKSINCDFYDQLEAYATLRKNVVIEYLNELNEIVQVKTVIKTLNTIEKEEFLILPSNEKIRLDKIKKIQLAS